MMHARAAKEPRRRKVFESTQSQERAVPEKKPVHSQPVSSGEDVQTRIANRAYEIYLERGSRSGYAINDWLEAEREILGPGCHA